MQTVLEIGSGSYKLCKLGAFSEKFESSLGKNLIDLTKAKRLNPESIKVAIKNLDEKILPFLKARGVVSPEVLVFATAAIRLSMADPLKSGENFLKELINRGFKNIRVFSEEEECLYGARAVIDEVRTLRPNLKNFLILDTGGASHQLVQVINLEPVKYKSFPIGSHTDLSINSLPDLISEGFSESSNLVILGTTGQILSGADSLSRSRDIYSDIQSLNIRLEAASITERKIILEYMVSDPKIKELFVEYRLAILPQAIKIILNVMKQLKSNALLNSKQEAIQFISKVGF
jgi:hypothetical protein